MVSNRYLSSVVSCRSHWGPSIHRSQWGVKEDHALVACSWKWRVRNRVIPELLTMRYGALISKATHDGPAPAAVDFDRSFRQKMTLKVTERVRVAAANWHAKDDFMDSEEEEVGQEADTLGQPLSPQSTTTQAEEVEEVDDFDIGFDDTVQSLAEYARGRLAESHQGGS